MFSPTEYCLLDFGAGRKLERFGNLILDRPSPVATGNKSNLAVWSSADAVFQEDPEQKRSALGRRGLWHGMTRLGQEYFCDSPESPARATWSVCHETPSFRLTLKGSPFGHIGVFPEQSPNWDSIYEWCRRFVSQKKRSPRVLNLFAYTGGSTLAAAAGGAEVFHVDAARNIVQQARDNGTKSFAGQNEIHWIVDDAVKYVLRCVKRGAKFDAIVLDPPTYGHGAKGEVWRFSKGMPGLLAGCFAILEKESSLVLFSCHVPQYTCDDLVTALDQACRDTLGASKSRQVVARQNYIRDANGKRLPTGLQGVLSDSDCAGLFVER